MGKAYDHKKIEKKWQALWEKKKVYKAKNPPSSKTSARRGKYYVLDMFPYPSGAGLHVGHPKGYIGSDVFARMKRMEGFNVLHPMGYDAFGLPAEQYAIEHNINPAQAVEKNVKTFEKQLSIIGLSYDWDRRVNTTDPDFYKWTQWMFLKFYDSWYNPIADKAEPIETLIKKFTKSDAGWKSKSAKEKQDALMQYRLAYEGYAEVNWCPKLGTVLANDEIVEGPNGPVSERGGYSVEKKNMRQWFMRTTAYAERLLAGLDSLDWPAHIKEIQRNWIGRSEGVMYKQKIKDLNINIEAYDSIPQTFMAQTFCVIAPEHALVKKLAQGTEYEKPVLSFVEEFKKRKLKNELETEKEIEGIFTGRYVDNPFGTGDLPIWIATFVIADYGTSIVNASAHDERDFAFAKKYNIPLRNVTEPLFVVTSGGDAVRNDKPLVEREAILAIVKHWSEDKYIGLKWKKADWGTFISGGVEKGQTPEQAARAEIEEETGYYNLKLVRSLGRYHGKFYHIPKGENRFGHFTTFYFELENGDQKEVSEKEKEKHEIMWLRKEEVKNFITPDSLRYVWDVLQGKEKPIVKNGILTQPPEFKGREWSEVREDIIDYIVKKGFGYRKINYKMRDAVFARQRYWGEPIPLMHDKNGIIHELPEKNLPFKLPPVKSYQPTGTGESPLAGVPAWVKAGYETNTMPGWAGSSWYFLRYMDPKNKKAFADKKNIKYWKNVDMYVGGAEHATGHLLYARFWHKFLRDYNLVPTDEPFRSLRNQGMILGTDNRKMGKRDGGKNAINPNDIVKTYGADTLRLYEMFMGPFAQSVAWSEEAILGPRRFLERVWKLGHVLAEKKDNSSAPELQTLLHKTIKKVSEDIETFSFNTCISGMMILLNAMEKEEHVDIKDFELFLKILSPFAPHIAEELWSLLGHKTLLAGEPWPTADEKKMKESEIKIVLQINGKVRAEILVPAGETEEKIKQKALENETISRHLLDKTLIKIIYVKGRLINIVTR